MAISDSKTRIIEASIDLFYEHGFTKASMRDIARTANVGLSVSYNHFKDKYDILNSIIIQIGADLCAAISSAIDENDSGIDALSNMVIKQLCMVKDRPKEIKIYLEDQYLLPLPLRLIVRAQHRSIYDKYYQQIELMERDGLLKEINKSVTTFSILAMVNWAHRWYIDDRGLSMEKIAEETLNIYFHGILKNEYKQSLHK